MNSKSPLVRPEQIEQAVLLIRGQRVMLDRDLAALYGVETKNLNRAVRRNRSRFPQDFMFQLTAEEAANLWCQNWHLKFWIRRTALPLARVSRAAGHGQRRFKIPNWNLEERPERLTDGGFLKKTANQYALIFQSRLSN